MAEKMRIKKMIGMGFMKDWMEGILRGCVVCFNQDTDNTGRMKDAQSNATSNFEGMSTEGRIFESWRFEAFLRFKYV